MASGMTVSQMLSGKAGGTGPVPTQTFYASNIAGTTVPKVGAAQSTSGVSNAGAFAGVSPMQIGLIVVVIIGIGYFLHHVNFEEAASGGIGIG